MSSTASDVLIAAIVDPVEPPMPPYNVDHLGEKAIWPQMNADERK